MLSNETISNIRLHRDTRLDAHAPPFIVSTSGNLQLPPGTRPTRRTTGVDRTVSSRSSKSATDAKTRAVSDSCMAAAIGDLQWLKQSIRDGPIGSGEATSIEQTYGKEGLAPIHLAALHGRLNCLTYLVENVHMDIDAPSSTGWRPIHLCISRETGSRAFPCLKYLIEHGAKINITNDDLLTPLHQAASEGHVQCLELLLAHNANVYAEDSRKQLPVDLAKLWGHKKCAKLLAAAMWHQNKHLSAKERLVSRNTKMADLLLEIKREHSILFEEKSEEKFDQWLRGIGTGSALPKTNQETTQIQSISQHIPREPSSSQNVTSLPAVTSDGQTAVRSKKRIPNRTRAQTFTNINRWNNSTHVKENPYVPDLPDAYPRDPFTKLPPRRDAIEIYRLLQTMTLADVKKFLSTRKDQTIQRKVTRKSEQERPVVYATCHVDDIQTLHKAKAGDENFRPLRHFDESGLHMSNDAHKSVFFQQLVEVLNGGEMNAAARKKLAEDKEKWTLFEQYGPELVDFLTDRHGQFKKEFDKVFIT